jgi:1,4-alpha-glucan branching enzyme
MSDELHPDEPLNAAVAALRTTPALVPGLVERTRERRRRVHRRRFTAGGVVASLAAAFAVGIALQDSDDGYTTFALVAPQTSGVSLVGDFTEWETDRVRLEPKGDDRWEVKVKLAPGRYRFAYVTDEGNWLADQSAPPALDDFGDPTSVVTVLNE